MSKKKKSEETQQDTAQKERKVKVVYYDDGSTIADMSGTSKNKTPRVKSTAKEKARTFFAVMKKMVLPMLCTLAAFTILYIILLAITGRL